MFEYLKFNCCHEDYPQNVVEIDAFGERGAKVKARKILSALHLISRQENIDRIKVWRAS